MTNDSKKIFKYVGPDYIDKVFSLADAITLKCSLPKEFNDPYELFLTIDYNEEPDTLAFYADAIGELPQLPATCFSRSPIVVPMWAHYAQNLQGFAVEFFEDRLAKAVPESVFADVQYLDAASKDLSELLRWAYQIGKMRYTYMLRRRVFNAAYFTKATCWSYEQERRMVLNEEQTRKVGHLLLFDAPKDCIASIICGPRAAESTRLVLINKAAEIGCRYFDLRIGKSSAVPYLVDLNGDPFSFDQDEIAPNLQHCEECKEPVAKARGRCSWCQIDDALRHQVAARNPFRILDHFGLLDSYIEGMDAITAGRRK